MARPTIAMHTKSQENEQMEWGVDLVEACAEGDLRRVRRLLEKDRRRGVDLHYKEESGFREACWYGHLEIVKYLTTNPEIKGMGYANIHALDDEGFLAACEQGHLEVVQFLTASSELKAAGHEWVDIRRGNGLEMTGRLVMVSPDPVLQWLVWGLPEERALAVESGSEMEKELMTMDWYRADVEKKSLTTELAKHETGQASGPRNGKGVLRI